MGHMPKVVKGRKHSRAARDAGAGGYVSQPKQDVPEEADRTTSKVDVMSRGQRKRRKHHERMERRMNFASKAAAKNNKDGNDVLGNVTALVGALDGVAASAWEKGAKKTKGLGTMTSK